MQINKDEIRRLDAAKVLEWLSVNMLTMSGWQLTESLTRGIVDGTFDAPDDAKDETIRQQAAEIERLTRMVSNAMKECADVVKATQEAEEARKAAEAEIERLKEFIETRTAQWMAALEREQELQSALHKSEEARKAAERERDELRKSQVELWECPDCGFAFDAVHQNDDGSGYSCPECELAKIHRDNAALRECLAWYAPAERYKQTYQATGPRMMLSEAEQDSGNRARTLLAELDRKEKEHGSDQ